MRHQPKPTGAILCPLLLCAVSVVGCSAAGSGADEFGFDRTESGTFSISHGGAVGPELSNLLGEREGWGKDTTGGLNGSVFVVDTLEDAGPRSLRAALTSDEPLWIVFADGLAGAIVLGSTIEPKSNKTVDARGHSIQIRTSTPGKMTAFRIAQQSNLIFTNLRLDDELPDWNRDDEGADGMWIANSTRIWVHHCQFSRWRDGAIDMKDKEGGKPSDISVTWSRFDRVFQALNWTADRVSFGHNYCKDVKRRCVQLIDGRGHSYNNVVEDWNAATIQNAKEGAQLLSERNVFVAGGQSQVNSREGGGKIKLVKNLAIGNVDFLGGSDNIDDGFVTQSQGLAVLEKCADGDDECWKGLSARVTLGAGVNDSQGSWPGVSDPGSGGSSPGTGGTTPNPPPAADNGLAKGESLLAGASRPSQDGRFVLTYQHDGNLVLYEVVSGQPLWATYTQGSSAGVTVMQSDGNLVVYDGSSVARWASGTGATAERLYVQDDGNLVIRDASGTPLWASNTGGH